jgi:hypothetical protein
MTNVLTLDTELASPLDCFKTADISFNQFAPASAKVSAAPAPTILAPSVVMAFWTPFTKRGHDWSFCLFTVQFKITHPVEATAFSEGQTATIRWEGPFNQAFKLYLYQCRTNCYGGNLYEWPKAGSGSFHSSSFPRQEMVITLPRPLASDSYHYRFVWVVCLFTAFLRIIHVLWADFGFTPRGELNSPSARALWFLPWPSRALLRPMTSIQVGTKQLLAVFPSACSF